jgi:hypothetical protein
MTAIISFLKAEFWLNSNEEPKDFDEMFFSGSMSSEHQL